MSDQRHLRAHVPQHDAADRLTALVAGTNRVARTVSAPLATTALRFRPVAVHRARV